MIDSRFGIDAPESVLESTSGEMQLRPAPREGNLVLQASNGDIISLPAALTVPMIPGLSSENFKLKIETSLFTAVLSNDEITFLQVDNPMDRKLPIEQLVELASFFSWSGDPISVKVVAADLLPFDFSISFSVTGNKGAWLKLANIAKTLREIQSRAGVTTVNLALRDLQNSWRELSFFHDILTAKDVQLGISALDLEPPFSRMLGYFDFEVGGITFLVVFDAPIIEQSTQENRILLVLGERVCRDCFVGEEADSVRAAGRASYERQSDRHGQDCLAFGNFRNLLRN